MITPILHLLKVKIQECGRLIYPKSIKWSERLTQVVPVPHSSCPSRRNPRQPAALKRYFSIKVAENILLGTLTMVRLASG